MYPPPVRSSSRNRGSAPKSTVQRHNSARSPMKSCDSQSRAVLIAKGNVQSVPSSV